MFLANEKNGKQTQSSMPVVCSLRFLVDQAGTSRAWIVSDLLQHRQSSDRPQRNARAWEKPKKIMRPAEDRDLGTTTALDLC